MLITLAPHSPKEAKDSKELEVMNAVGQLEKIQVKKSELENGNKPNCNGPASPQYQLCSILSDCEMGSVSTNCGTPLIILGWCESVHQCCRATSTARTVRATAFGLDLQESRLHRQGQKREVRPLRPKEQQAHQSAVHWF